MLTEDGKHLYVSYDEYHNLIEKLAIKVHQSDWQFDTILCLARGGMRPGDILSRIFDKPLAIGTAGQATIGEALIMTALGLAVAIPAVLGYNALVRGNKGVLQKLNRFAHDLHAYFVTGARVSAAAPGRVVAMKKG